jgi:DNA-binding XRE family transcriptional regulator
MEVPNKDELAEFRREHGLSQSQAAKLIYTPTSTWQKWELGINGIHPGLWELFQLKAKVRMEQLGKQPENVG